MFCQLTDELKQQHEYEEQQLRTELNEEHERKMSSLRHEMEELNDNEECQFMDSLNVSRFTLNESKRREEHEAEMKKLKQSHGEEILRLKKALDDELKELKKTLEEKVCLWYRTIPIVFAFQSIRSRFEIRL